MCKVLGIVKSCINSELVNAELCECNCGKEFTRAKGSKNNLCRECELEDYFLENYVFNESEKS